MQIGTSDARGEAVGGRRRPISSKGQLQNDARSTLRLQQCSPVVAGGISALRASAQCQETCSEDLLTEPRHVTQQPQRDTRTNFEESQAENERSDGDDEVENQ